MSALVSPKSSASKGQKEIEAMGKLGARRGHRRVGLRGLLVVVAMVMLLATMVAAAQAAAPAMTLRTNFPDTAEGGARDIKFLFGPPQKGQIIRADLFIENSGNAAMNGTLTSKVTLPAGMSVRGEPETEGPASGSCNVAGQLITCNIDGSQMLPNVDERVRMRVELAPDVSGALTSTIEVSGGGVAEPVQREETVQVGAPLPFSVDAFRAFIQDANNVDDTQAGAPPGVAANSFKIPSFGYENFEGGFQPGAFSINAPVGHIRNVVVHTPAGLTTNFAATPSRCTAAQLGGQLPPQAGELIQLPACPLDSQIGVAHIDASNHFFEPVYNMVPPPGVPAEFGFAVINVPILIDAQLRPDDFGVDLVSKNTSTTLPITKVEVAIWGSPADSSHDTSRGLCLRGGEFGHAPQYPDGCPTTEPRKAFLRLPTSCNGPLPWKVDIDTYQEPNNYRSSQTTTPAQVGCNQLEFEPSFEAKPTTNLGDSPSGLEVKLHLPQNEDPDGLAEAHLKNLTMQLPPGLVINSASADGLAACSPGQIGMLSPPGQIPPRFDGEVPRCPDASKLGAVVVNTPAIDHPLPGFVYLAQQRQNPYGSLLALYLVINDPVSGVVVKVPIQAKLDPNTGQITTVVQQSPQLPFEDLSLELDQGAHAPLRTPVACGSFTTQSDWTPWSSPEGKDEHPTSSFEIAKGAGGSSCVGSEAQAPFEPKLSAGTMEPKAGAFSPFTLKLSRADGTQPIKQISLDLPKGLLASLGGIPYCSDAILNSIPTAPGSGAGEIAHPSCPAASRLGTVSAQVGAGPNPMNVTTGRAYWTGPYKGAPVGLAVVFPAVAGPFDLGNVVVRNGFYVNPETAQITAKSDPIPSMIEGIPLDLRSVRVDLDRPNYTLNPTSCDPMSFEGMISSTLGSTAQRSEHFQVGGCQNLGFKPSLGLKLKGGTTRGKHPALTATLKFPKTRGANIAKASVALPHSEFLDQSHIGTVCTRVQFAADACPARSVYGYARTYSPILDYYLAGPVYLRSSNHKLPDLVVDLKGQIEVALVGRIDTDKKGGIRTTFESVPDAPVSKFTLQMQGGKKGLLQNSTNLCRGTHEATAIFDAQNGKSAELSPKLQADCSKKAKKHSGSKKHGY